MSGYEVEDSALTLTEFEAALYKTVLRNIANTAWNAGRTVPITVEEYAGEALRIGEGVAKSPPPLRA